jgi:tetratricopeptide (TPR) repeat protein
VGGPLPSVEEAPGEKKYGLKIDAYIARMEGENYIYANLGVEGGIFNEERKIGDIPGIRFSSFKEEEYIGPGSSIVLVSMAEVPEPRKIIETPVLKSLPMIGKLFESVVFLTGERKLAGFFWFDFKKAEEEEPDLAAAHKNLGLAYIKKGWKDKAISEFSESLKLNPNQPSLLSLVEKLKRELDPGSKGKRKRKEKK